VGEGGGEQVAWRETIYDCRSKLRESKAALGALNQCSDPQWID
jgi:hypothetical protein